MVEVIPEALGTNLTRDYLRVTTDESLAFSDSDYQAPVEVVFVFQTKLSVTGKSGRASVENVEAIVGIFGSSEAVDRTAGFSVVSR